MISYRKRMISFKEKVALGDDFEALPFRAREIARMQATRDAREKARDTFFAHVREHIGNEAYEYEQARYAALVECQRTVLGYFVTEHELTLFGREYAWKTTAINYNLFEKGRAGLRDIRTIALAPKDPSLTDYILGLAFSVPLEVVEEKKGFPSLRGLWDYLKKERIHNRELIEEICVHEGRHIDAAQRRGYQLRGITYRASTLKVFGRPVGNTTFTITARFPSIAARDVSYIALAPPHPSLSDWIIGIGWYDLRNLPQDIAKKMRGST